MRHISFSAGPLPPAVKGLLAANAAVWFFLVMIVQKIFLDEPLVFQILGLVPARVFEQLWIWQIFTYMFVHSGGVFHILLNMLILWMFGSELERFWGSRLFLLYGLSCGAGAALIYLLCSGVLALAFGLNPQLLYQPVIGFSGAAFGLLLAYGLIFSERVVYLMGIFPIKARNFVILVAAIELFSALDSGFGGPVANLAHLGGLASGLAFLKIWKISQRLAAESLDGRPKLFFRFRAKKAGKNRRRLRILRKNSGEGRGENANGGGPALH